MSLRSALVGLKLISLGKDDEKRCVLVRKYLRWVKDGFQSLNRYLYKNSPMHIEIVDIHEYYHSLYCVALMGQEEEIALTLEQARHALDCVPRKLKCYNDIRQLLTRLNNIKNLERTGEYRLSELNNMTRMLSRSDRARNMLSSPVTLLLVSVVPILLQILSMLKLV